MTIPPSAFQGPYRGLEPFDEDAAGYFFGRERESRLIVASLFASPLTLLYGASGVGKSSVLRAGVLPELRQRPNVLPVVFPRLSTGSLSGTKRIESGWQLDPVNGIKDTMLRAVVETASGDFAREKKLYNALRKYDGAPLRDFADACSDVSEKRLMVILDQFEEYSLYHPEDESFAEQFPRSLGLGEFPISFLLSMREDSLAQLDRFKASIPILWDSYRRIDHLDPEAARSAIRLPLGRYNEAHPAERPVTIESELVELVIREVRTGNELLETRGVGNVAVAAGLIETPYLQLVMSRLWEREREEGSSELRAATLLAEGGAAQIVRSHLDRVMARFTDEERDIAARVFHRLVTPSGAKIACSASDLAALDEVDEAVLRSILERLAEGEQRILRPVADRTGNSQVRFEIFHDRLGDAILRWRLQHMERRKMEERSRFEVAKKRLAQQSIEPIRARVEDAMAELNSEQRRIWSTVLFLLVTPAGGRVSITMDDLMSITDLPPQKVLGVMTALERHGLLQHTKERGGRWEVAHDLIAAAFLQWHSENIRSRVEPGYVADPTVRRDGSAALRESAEAFPFSIVAKGLKSGQVIPLVGAGASVSGRNERAREARGYPTQREFRDRLGDACDFPRRELPHADLAEVASYFAYRFNRSQLDQFLGAALGPGVGRPSEAHRVLADCARRSPLIILTTNYDVLMEQALSEAGARFGTISYWSGDRSKGQAGFRLADYTGTKTLAAAEEALRTRDMTYVIRLQGGGLTPEGPGRYVITEEDQIDWLLGMTAPGSLVHLISPLLQSNSVLSLGQSARDWAQRALFRQLTRFDSRRKRWAVALHPSELSVMTWQRYGLEIFNIDLNDWAKDMRSALGLA